jgi:hypothetical protein
MVSSADLESGEEWMVYWSLMYIFTFFLDIFTIMGITDSNKDREILILFQQVRILQRKMKTPKRISDSERMILATLTNKSRQSSKDARQHLNQLLLIFQPDTVLRWYRERVHRKWTCRRKGNPGRPDLSSELKALTVRLAEENPRWGYDKIQGELLKPGYNLSASSMCNILKRQRLTPAYGRPSIIVIYSCV